MKLALETSVSVIMTPERSKPGASAPESLHWRKSYSLSLAAFACPMVLLLKEHLVLSLKSIGGSLNFSVWPSAMAGRGEERREKDIKVAIVTFARVSLIISRALEESSDTPKSFDDTEVSNLVAGGTKALQGAKIDRNATRDSFIVSVLSVQSFEVVTKLWK